MSLANLKFSNTDLQGDAKAQICEFCEDQSMDLLVVTSTVRGRFKKALSPMGGVSTQLVLEAPCPVLVLPTQASSKCPALLCFYWSKVVKAELPWKTSVLLSQTPTLFQDLPHQMLSAKIGQILLLLLPLLCFGVVIVCLLPMPVLLLLKEGRARLRVINPCRLLLCRLHIGSCCCQTNLTADALPCGLCRHCSMPCTVSNQQQQTSHAPQPCSCHLVF